MLQQVEVKSGERKARATHPTRLTLQNSKYFVGNSVYSIGFNGRNDYHFAGVKEGKLLSIREECFYQTMVSIDSDRVLWDKKYVKIDAEVIGSYLCTDLGNDKFLAIYIVDECNGNFYYIDCNGVVRTLPKEFHRHSWWKCDAFYLGKLWLQRQEGKYIRRTRKNIFNGNVLGEFKMQKVDKDGFLYLLAGNKGIRLTFDFVDTFWEVV